MLTGDLVRPAASASEDPRPLEVDWLPPPAATGGTRRQSLIALFHQRVNQPRYAWESAARHLYEGERTHWRPAPGLAKVLADAANLHATRYLRFRRTTYARVSFARGPPAGVTPICSILERARMCCKPWQTSST